MPIKKNDIVIPLIKETYLAVIKNSINSKMFQTYFATINGKKQNIMKNGEVSCAFFVSAITTLFDLSERIHGTVDGTTADLLKKGWKEIKTPRIGAIIIWDEMIFNKEAHKHIGFYISKNQAISNSCYKKVPVQHHWKFNNKRKITTILWNNKLNK